MQPRATPFAISFLTLFPETLATWTSSSIWGRAQKAGIVDVDLRQIREYATDKHRKCDDSPCGGGPGLVMRVDVVHRALQATIHDHEKKYAAPSESTATESDKPRRRCVILLEAAGRPFRQEDARALAEYDHLVFLCGHYEGIDTRIREYCDESFSIGDYVLTGGELAALVIADATMRLLPGALGNIDSAVDESFQNHLLEHQQYTRPISYDGKAVPPVLLSGNHRAIERARRRDQMLRTQKMRPDLWSRWERSKADEKIWKDTNIPSLSPVAVTVDEDS